jgi:FKBP-type peptidyl-prolyl cis-trans isomerase
MPPMRKVLLTILALAVLLGGCGGGSSSTDESTSTTAELKPFRIPHGNPPIRYEEKMHPDASGLVGKEPKPIIPDSPPPEFISVADIIEGIGHIATRGRKVTIQYVGYDYETGKKFVSSWEQGKPFTFTMGKGEVIPGWEEGLEGIEGGDRRELVLPADKTEGSYPPGIPKGKAVVFVVDAIPPKGKKPSQPEPKPEKPPTTNKTKPKVKVPSGPPPKKLVIKDLEKGKGPGAKLGDEVTVEYVGVLYSNGKQFDASWDRGEPFTFELGTGGVIQGWEQGIEGMKVGGRRELIIPPELAYGSEGGGAIPPNSTLVFVVDLLAIN